MELRCPSKLHGIIVSDGLVEVKCDSRFCRPDRNTIVLHRFDVVTGRLVETLKFKNPKQGKEHQ